MKLNHRSVLPPNNTLHFAVNNRTENNWFKTKHSSGFVGVVLFEDGKWYSMPLKQEVSEYDDFYWIELEHFTL